MMVLIPILFTAIVITVCFHTSLGSYWYTLEAIYSDENSIQFAQSMIYTYQKELWENNWGQDKDTALAEEIKRTDEMKAVHRQRTDQGVVNYLKNYILKYLYGICRALRQSLHLPIIMVTAKKEDIDKIRGLGLGADDYLVEIV